VSQLPVCCMLHDETRDCTCLFFLFLLIQKQSMYRLIFRQRLPKGSKWSPRRLHSLVEEYYSGIKSRNYRYHPQGILSMTLSTSKSSLQKSQLDNQRKDHPKHRNPRLKRHGRSRNKNIDDKTNVKEVKSGIRRTRTNYNAEVFTDFARLVERSQAARYKVHKPNCSCPKVRALSISKPNGTADQEKQRTGFIVLPDTKSTRSLFIGGSASAESYALDPLACEQELHDIIFSQETQAKISTPVKVSCASCILNIEANGFLCISSPSKSIINYAKDRANEARLSKIDGGTNLHSDHADYVCSLSQDLLLKLSKSRKRQPGAGPSPTESLLIQDLRDQGVDMENADTLNKLTIGHHLKNMLTILKGKGQFIFAIVSRSYKKDQCVLDIDLPGGKRHLGETSFQCVVRETEEETSLRIEKKWLVGDGIPLQSKNSGERGNVFFLARPPDDDLLKDIGKDVFWTKAGNKD
jgi:hypothetical protein